MPKIPREIHRAVQHETEQKKIGEEGTLHKIPLGEEHYWAKKWRSRHYFQTAQTAAEYAESEKWKTTVSPFWHKAISYETKLIDDALPGMTLRIESSFDPRVSKSGEEFNFKAGRPTTVAKDVKGDKVLREKRDNIVDESYDFLWNQTSYDEQGRNKGSKDRLGVMMNAWETDKVMREAFGEFLGVRDWIQGYMSEKDWESFVRKVNQTYPDTDVAQMVNAGVVPVHAEYNYIPTEEIGENKTRGIFIETAIFDDGRLKKALLESARQKNSGEFDERNIREKIDARLERLHLFQRIDNLWDVIFYPQKNRSDDSHEMFFDNRLGGAIFKALDSIRDRYDKGGINLFHDKTFEYQSRVKAYNIASSFSLAQGLERTQEFEQFIRSWPAQQQEVPSQQKAA